MTPGRSPLGCRSVNLFSWPFYPLVQLNYLFTNVFLLIHRSWRKTQSRHTRIFCQHWKKGWKEIYTGCTTNRFTVLISYCFLNMLWNQWFWLSVTFSCGSKSVHRRNFNTDKDLKKSRDEELLRTSQSFFSRSIEWVFCGVVVSV